MAIMTPRGSGLEDHGFSPRGRVYWNPTTALLYTHSLLNGEGKLAEGGPIVVDTGRFTGRSPKDKFIVKESESEDRIGWGAVNQPIEEESFEGLREKVIAYLEEQETIYVTDAYAGADPAHRIGVRVVTAHPYHALFSKTMFIEPEEDELTGFEPDSLVLHAPGVEASPEEDGTRTETFVVLHPSRSEVVIGGTYYGGEIKKSIFSRHERPAAARRGVAHALLRERRPPRQSRDLLRTVGNRKDDALSRRGAVLDRRRRARMG